MNMDVQGPLESFCNWSKGIRGKLVQTTKAQPPKSSAKTIEGKYHYQYSVIVDSRTSWHYGNNIPYFFWKPFIFWGCTCNYFCSPNKYIQEINREEFFRNFVPYRASFQSQSPHWSLLSTMKFFICRLELYADHKCFNFFDLRRLVNKLKLD